MRQNIRNHKTTRKDDYLHQDNSIKKRKRRRDIESEEVEIATRSCDEEQESEVEEYNI